MKPEMKPIGWSLLIRLSGSPRSTVRSAYLPNRLIGRFLAVAGVLLSIAGLSGCSSAVGPLSGGGTSTEVVGKIVAPDNSAVEGVQVLLLDTLQKETNGFIDTIAATTDKNGNFAIRVDSSGHYLLTAKDPAGRSYMDEVNVTNDAPTLSLGTLKVDTTGSVSGFIHDNTNFKANITVILYKKDMPFMYLWRRGAFTIDSLAPGDVRIQIGGWIDDYSRANKWITFLDSTIRIDPGRKTVIDTVFINESTLNKAYGLSMDVPGSDGDGRYPAVCGYYCPADCFLRCICPGMSITLQHRSIAESKLLSSDATVGAAAYRVFTIPYAVSDATVNYRYDC